MEEHIFVIVNGLRVKIKMSYHIIIFIFSNSTRFYVMSSRISSNLTRHDVKADTIRKIEYK